jgi:NOL1/NOP2/fmu family ribosome biogenesis protein
VAEQQDDIRREFEDVVNMAPKELERWLETDESKSVGWGEGESVGHESGRRIDDADYEHMRRVIGYARRHLAQGGPTDDPEHLRWRYSLKNWSHDALKG